MLKSRREAGFIALVGIVVVLAGAAVHSPDKTATYVLGVLVFLVGAVPWLLMANPKIDASVRRARSWFTDRYGHKLPWLLLGIGLVVLVVVLSSIVFPS